MESVIKTPPKKRLLESIRNKDSRYIIPSPDIKDKTGEENDQFENLETLRNSNTHIVVAIRCRPLSVKESSITELETISFVDEKVIVFHDPILEEDFRESTKSPRPNKHFTFDNVFDQSVSNYEVYEKCAKSLVPGILAGYNATVFAYGATGAGKTYTMMGTQDNPGIMPFTLGELFTQINSNKQEKIFDIKVSFLEVYNETLIDLIANTNVNLDIREDPDKGVIINGVCERHVSNEEEILNLLKIGSKNRTMESTKANEVSSRSHAILQIMIEQNVRDVNGFSEEVLFSKLSLIDLAGSERAATSQNTGMRMKEGANINKSLLALSNCITALVEKMEKGLKNLYVPYRDSKLTRMLKDSLGGNCRTVIIANVSPSVICYEDTNNTLKFADKAKRIKTVVTKKVLVANRNLDKFAKMITNLQSENENLKKMLKTQQMITTIYSSQAYGGRSSIVPSLFGEESHLETQEIMFSSLQSHFESEKKLLKQLHDLHMIHDEYFIKIKDMTEQLSKEENLNLREELSSLITTQKNILLQLQSTRSNIEFMEKNREKLFKKIIDEPSKEVVENGVSLFRQLQSQIDDLKLEYKEKRKEQKKLNFDQVEYLQSQLSNFSHDKMVNILHFFAKKSEPKELSPIKLVNEIEESNLSSEIESLKRMARTPPPFRRRMESSESRNLKTEQDGAQTDRSQNQSEKLLLLRPIPPPSRPKGRSGSLKRAPPKSSSNAISILKYTPPIDGSSQEAHFSLLNPRENTDQKNTEINRPLPPFRGLNNRPSREKKFRVISDSQIPTRPPLTAREIRSKDENELVDHITSIYLQNDVASISENKSKVMAFKEPKEIVESVGLISKRNRLPSLQKSGYQEQN